MVAPLLVIVGATSYILGSVVNQVGRHYLSDKSARLNIEQRREELAALEKRVLLEQAERRDLKMREFEHQLLLQANQHSHERNAKEDHFRLERWPLHVQPMDYIRHSAKQTNSTLNIIFTVSPSIDPKRRESTIELFESPLAVVEKHVLEFKNDVSFFDETRRMSPHTGMGLRVALWNMLQTETTVLIEANTKDKDAIILNIAHWGDAFTLQGEGPILQCPSLKIDLSSIPLTDAAQRQEALGLALSSVAVSLGDAFRTLQRPHVAAAPVLPSLMQAAFLPEDDWKLMMNAYLDTYQRVALHSPIVAPDLAAKAALTALEAGQTNFAGMLLEKALDLFRKAADHPIESDEAIMAEIAQHRDGSTHTNLELALQTMRGLEPSHPPPRISLREIAQIGVSSLQ